MGRRPKIPAPPPPSPEELELRRLQSEMLREQLRAAQEARAKAEAENAGMLAAQAEDRRARALGLRGRRALLSQAGELGFPTLGGV